MHYYETEIDACKTTINELEDQIGEYKLQIEDLTRMMQETQVSYSIFFTQLSMKQQGYSDVMREREKILFSLFQKTTDAKTTDGMERN